MLQWLRKVICRLLKNTDGSPGVTVTKEVTNPCYTKINTSHRWQGDIYRSEDFTNSPVPADTIPYWMLLNRTCQLVESENQRVNLAYLVFCTVLPLHAFMKSSSSNSNTRNQVSNIVKVKDKTDFVGFIPESSEFGINEPYVADFNMIWSFRFEDCPAAGNKLAQLSSPFCEHFMQRFSRWFYTVGYDDSYKKPEYINALVDQVEKINNPES